MTKPWRMVALHIGSWIALGLIWCGEGNFRIAGLDRSSIGRCLIVIAGCIETIAVRLRRNFAVLERKAIRRREVRTMSPEAALHSDVFKIYLAILLGMLAVAGAAIGVLGLILKKDVAHAWKSYRSWLIMIPLVLVCVFLGPAGDDRILHAAGNLRLQGIRPGDRLVSRLVDDRRGLSRHFGSGRAFGHDRSAAGHAGLVRHVHRLAGVCHRADSADSDPSQSNARATANHRPGAVGIHLHRLDVRAYRLSGERQRRLRLPLLFDFRRGTERRGGLHFRQNVRAASRCGAISARKKPGKARSARWPFRCCCRGFCGFPSRTSPPAI